MGQAKTRGTRDDRVQQALARRMDTANRRMEQQGRLAERFELVKRVMDGDTSVQLPQRVLDRLKPLGLTAVGVGYDSPVMIERAPLIEFSPEAAAQAYAAGAFGTTPMPTLPVGDHDVRALSATLDRMDVPREGRELHVLDASGGTVILGIDPGNPEGDRTAYWDPNLQLPVQDPADADLEAAVRQLVEGQS